MKQAELLLQTLTHFANSFLNAIEERIVTVFVLIIVTLLISLFLEKRKIIIMQSAMMLNKTTEKFESIIGDLLSCISEAEDCCKYYFNNSFTEGTLVSDNEVESVTKKVQETRQSLFKYKYWFSAKSFKYISNVLNNTDNVCNKLQSLIDEYRTKPTDKRFQKKCKNFLADIQKEKRKKLDAISLISRI